MKTPAVCALLSVVAWLTYAVTSVGEAALIFAAVWMSMAASYGWRTLSSRRVNRADRRDGPP